MTALPLGTGDRAVLVPRTLTAPPITYTQPDCTILRRIDYVWFEVRLDDGTQLRIHEDNVRRTRPEPPRARTRIPRPRPPVELPDGWEEASLW